MEKIPDSTIVTEAPKKISLLWRIIRIIIIVIVAMTLLMAGFMALGFHRLRTSVIDGFFGGDEKLFEEYIETQESINEAYLTGNYEQCLSLDPRQKQSCLYQASEASVDKRICDNMDPNLYSPDNMFSQESCYIHIALQTNDRSVCDTVVEKENCLFNFQRRDNYFKACGPLFRDDYYPGKKECEQYVMEQNNPELCQYLAQTFEQKRCRENMGSSTPENTADDASTIIRQQYDLDETIQIDTFFTDTSSGLLIAKSFRSNSSACCTLYSLNTNSNPITVQKLDVVFDLSGGDVQSPGGSMFFKYNHDASITIVDVATQTSKDIILTKDDETLWDGSIGYDGATYGNIRWLSDAQIEYSVYDKEVVLSKTVPPSELQPIETRVVTIE